MKKILIFILALALAATASVTQIFAISVTTSSNLIDKASWVCKDDDLNDVTDNPITVNSDGTIALTEEHGQWWGIYQQVAVQPSTHYVLTITTTLTAGRMRADWKNVTAENWTESPAFFPRNDEDWNTPDYGKPWTQSFDIETDEGQTVLELFIRNTGPWDEDPWWIKAVGTINSILLTTESVDIIVSYSDATASDGKIDHLYLNAVIPEDVSGDVGIVFSDSESTCKFVADGGNPLFSRVCKKYSALMESGCYGDAVITAINLGGDEGDKVIAVYWQDMPAMTLYARTFVRTSSGTTYGGIVIINLADDGTNVLPLAGGIDVGQDPIVGPEF